MNFILLYNTGHDFGRLHLNLVNKNMDSARTHLVALLVDIPMIEEEHGVDLSTYSKNYQHLLDILDGKFPQTRDTGPEVLASILLAKLKGGLEGELQRQSEGQPKWEDRFPPVKEEEQ